MAMYAREDALDVFNHLAFIKVHATQVDDIIRLLCYADCTCRSVVSTEIGAQSLNRGIGNRDPDLTNRKSKKMCHLTLDLWSGQRRKKDGNY